MSEPPAAPRFSRHSLRLYRIQSMALDGYLLAAHRRVPPLSTLGPRLHKLPGSLYALRANKPSAIASKALQCAIPPASGHTNTSWLCGLSSILALLILRAQWTVDDIHRLRSALQGPANRLDIMRSLRSPRPHPQHREGRPSPTWGLNRPPAIRVSPAMLFDGLR